MATDVCALVHRDHEELDRTIGAMLDARRLTEQQELLDGLRIGLVAHVAAQTAVLSTAVNNASSAVLRLLIGQIEGEHRRQIAALDDLTAQTAGSAAWLERMLELRVQLLDHARRSELFPGSLRDHIAAGERAALAGRYATERLRALSALAPLVTARDAAFARLR